MKHKEAARQLTIEDLKATKAAVVLKLPQNDPTVWFYQAVELYENQQFQDSLDLFIMAFKSRILHAWPYLNRLMEPTAPLVQVSAEQRALFDEFQGQACAFKFSEFGINSFYHVSQAIIAHDKSFAKEQLQPGNKKSDKKTQNANTKKSKAQREREAYFKSKTESCSHFHYHASSILTEGGSAKRFLAARIGHLLAIADCVSTNSKGTPPHLHTVYSQLLCSSAYHEKHAKLSFAERIFLSVVKQKEGVGKQELHFESCKLGVLFAFSMIANVQFFTQEKFDQAIGMLHFAVQHNDPQSRILYSTCIMKASDAVKKSKANVGHETVVSMLLSNIAGNFARSSVVYSETQEAFYRQLAPRSAVKLLDYISFFCNDEALLRLPHVVDQLEATAKQYAEQRELSLPIYGALHQITSRQRRLTESHKEKVALDNKTIAFLDKYLEDAYDTQTALDKFLIAKEKFKSLSRIPEVEKSQLVQEYLGIVKFIERFERDILASGNPHKFSQQKILDFILFSFSIFSYLYGSFCEDSIKADNFAEIEKNYLKYRDVGISFHIRECVVATTSVLVHKEKNYAKARELWASYKGTHTQASLVSEAMTYLDSADLSRDEAITAMERRGAVTPMFYDLLGDFFKTGFVGIQQNRLRARHYFELGASAGFLESTLSLGILAMEDYDTAPEEQKPSLREIATTNFEKLVAVSHCDGYLFRGKLSLYGTCGVPHDLDKAKSDFSRASELGNLEAGALLAMIEKGYTGSSQTVTQLRARFNYLSQQGKLKSSPQDLCHYGILLLSTDDPETGLNNILDAAVFNVPDAQCLIASFQLMDQVGELNLREDILQRIQQFDCAPFHQSFYDLRISPAIRNIYEFSLTMKKGIEDGREIGFDYFMETLTNVVLSKTCDINSVIEEMHKKFPDLARKKTLELAQKMNSPASGDQVCESYTRSLFSDAATPQEKMMKKLKSLKEGEAKLTEHNIRECLGSFFRSSALLQGKDKKAVTAVQKMHPHHGDGSHKGNDEIEGGRRKTAIQGFEAMIRSTQEMMDNVNRHGAKEEGAVKDTELRSQFESTQKMNK